jgi:signal transduction histidine kinase
VLSRLRTRLTLLYSLAALALISLLTFATYQVVRLEFQASNDLALRYRLAQQLQWQGFPLPDELANVGVEWQQRGGQIVEGGAAVAAPLEESEEENEEEDESLEGSPEDLDSFDADLAPLFVLSSASQILRPVAVNPNLPLRAPYAPAAEAALVRGSDLRTIALEDGSLVRLLTYRLPVEGSDQVIQVGRALTDQQRVLDRLLRVLAVLGGAGALVLACGSWWLAGKTLVPAQQAWEKQQAFIANASHELRAPLTLIRASAEVAQRGLPRRDAGWPLLADILDEIDHMATLVDDLLLLSRLDAGRLRIEIQDIRLQALFSEIDRSAGRVAAERQVQLVIAADPALTLRADPTRLRQVILILIDNALRFTPAGGRVEVRALSQPTQVQIEVQDSGPGIDPADLPHVFERFYRSSSNESPRGTGLGLAIAKAMVEAQAGTIELANGPSLGTVARIRLPSAGTTSDVGQ